MKKILNLLVKILQFKEQEDVEEGKILEFVIDYIQLKNMKNLEIID